MASFGTLSRLSAVLTLDATKFMLSAELVSKKLQQLRGQAIAFGQGFSRTFTLAFGLVSASAINVAASFDRLQAQLQAVTGGRGMDALRSQALDLGRTTIFTATQVANLQLELTKLGFGAEQTASAVESTTKIAAVFGGDLVKTGTTIAEVVRQFSNQNLSASRVADVMAVAFKNTALSTENFAQAMKNVGSVANITGNDFETTVALLGLLANAGQKGGIAGTRLKGVMIRLGKELGVTGDELQLLTSGQLDFNQLIEIFRNRAGVAAAVISEMGDEFQILKAQLLDARGAADAMESALQNRLFFALERIKASTEAIGITLGDAFNNTLQKVANVFESIADSVAKTDKSTLEFAVRLGTVLAIIPPLVFVLTSLGSALTALVTTAGGPVVAALTGFILLVTSSFATLSQTEGVINRTEEQMSALSQRLSEAASKGAAELTEQVKVLNEELDKVAGDDRLDEAAKLQATENLQKSIAKLNDELDGLQQFGTSQYDQSLKKFLEVVKRNSAEIGRLKGELNDLQESEIIEQLQGAQARGTMTGRGYDLLQDLLGQEQQLQIDIEFNREEIELYRRAFLDKFNNLDLSIFSEGQLTAEAASLDKLVRDLDSSIATATKQLETPFENFVTDLGTGFRQDFALAIESLNRVFGGEGLAGIQSGASKVFQEFEGRYRTQENIQRDINVAVAEREAILGQIVILEEEIARQQEKQRVIAFEAAEAARLFTGIFKDQAEAADAVKSFDKLKESLKAIAAQFAVTTGEIGSTDDDIASLTNRYESLTQVLTQGNFDIDVLGEAFKKNQGSIKERIEAAQALASAYGQFQAEQLAAGRTDLALVFDQAREKAERLVKLLERRDAIKTIADTSDAQSKLNEYLKDNDVINQVQLLQAEISRLDQAIRSKQPLGEDATKDIRDLKLLQEELKELQEVVKDTQFNLRLGLGDPRVQLGGLNARLEATIGLLQEEGDAAIAKLNKSFNELSNKAGVVDNAFDLGNDKIVSLEAVDAAILNNLRSLDRLSATTEDYQRVQANDEELRAFRDLLLETYRILGLNEQGVAGLTTKLEALQSQVSFQDNLLQLETLGDQLFLGLITPLDEATQRLGILRDAFLEAYNNPDVLAGSGYTLETLGNQIVAAEELTKQLEKYASIQQFVQDQVSFIGEAFIAAAKDGEDFFEALKKGFLNTFYALIGKLITLIALFAVLNILTGGAFMKGGQANTSFAQFLGQGFGISGGGTQSSNIGSLFDVLNNRNLAVEGSISGNNIVLANQRGTRAIDRTFG